MAAERRLAACSRTALIRLSSSNAPSRKKYSKMAAMIVFGISSWLPRFPIGFSGAQSEFVSGLRKGLLVVRVPCKSGSLATARFALEQNRDLFGHDRSDHAPNFFGSHALIPSGAELRYETQEDILEAYGIVPRSIARKKSTTLPPKTSLSCKPAREFPCLSMLTK